MFRETKCNLIWWSHFGIDWLLGECSMLGGWYFINFIEPPVQYIYHPGFEWTKKRKRRPSGNGESSIHRGIMTEPESIHLQIECYSLDWTDTKSNRFSAFPMEFIADKLLPGCSTPPLVKAVFVHTKLLVLENSKPLNWFQLRPIKINFKSNLASLCLIWTTHKRKWISIWNVEFSDGQLCTVTNINQWYITPVWSQLKSSSFPNLIIISFHFPPIDLYNSCTHTHTLTHSHTIYIYIYIYYIYIHLLRLLLLLFGCIENVAVRDCHL